MRAIVRPKLLVNPALKISQHNQTEILHSAKSTHRYKTTKFFYMAVSCQNTARNSQAAFTEVILLL